MLLPGDTLVLTPNVWANENPKVDTRFRESNSGPSDCEANAQPHDHGHHTILSRLGDLWTEQQNFKLFGNWDFSQRTILSWLKW